MPIQIRANVNANANHECECECKRKSCMQMHHTSTTAYDTHVHTYIYIYMPSLFVRTIDPTRRVPSLYSSYYSLLRHVMTPLSLLLNYMYVPTAIPYYTRDKTLTRFFAELFTDLNSSHTFHST